MQRRLTPARALLLFLLVAILAGCQVVDGTPTEPPPTGTPTELPPTAVSPLLTPDPPHSPIPMPQQDDELPVHITYFTNPQANRPTIVITLDCYEFSAVTIVLQFSPDPDKE